MLLKLVNGKTSVVLTKREKAILGDAQILCRTLAPICLTATEAADRLRDVRAFLGIDEAGAPATPADATETATA